MANKQNLNIAIIGGGICGLTVAVALQKMAIKAHVFEATVCSRSLSVFGLYMSAVS